VLKAAPDIHGQASIDVDVEHDYIGSVEGRHV